MKTCPQCGGITFEDMGTCFQCLHVFKEGEGLGAALCSGSLIVEGEQGRRSYPLSEEETIRIGRSPSNEIVLNAPNISRHHAVIEVRKGSVFIEDKGSANHTYVNGRRVYAYTKLLKGDVVRICGCTLRYE